MKEILTKTLNEMSYVFSSNEFSKRAKKNGLLQTLINGGALSSFLHNNAIQDGSRRMWRKKNDLIFEKSKSEQIADAIKLLKSEGFKIMKPVNDWIEC